MSLIGIHTSDGVVRTCSVGDNGKLEYTDCADVETSFTIDDFLSPAERFAPEISNCLRDRNQPVSVSLPGGAFQTRRVPLEVAEEVDRRSQVDWEVGQTLAARKGDYSVEYAVRGSSAIWIAIPRRCIEAITLAFETCGVSVASICAGPVALLQVLVREHPVGAATAILAESGWVSTVVIEDSALVSLTTDRAAEHARRDERSELREFASGQTAQPSVDVPVPVYYVGRTDLLTDSCSVSNGSRALLPPAGKRDNREKDTLTTVAYGAALLAISEKPI